MGISKNYKRRCVLIIKQKTNLQFYGGSYVALIPTLVFIVLTSIFTLKWKFFSLKALVVAALIGLLIGFLLTKNKQQYWKTMISGLTKFGNAKLIFVFMIIGVFTKLLIVGKIGAGFIWLSLFLGIHGATFTILAFLGSGIIALGVGVPFPALFASVPIFYTPGILLGANPAILCGAIIGGVHLGDALAIHSQLTYATSEGQTNNDNFTTANIKYILNQRTPWMIIIGAVTIVLLLLFGGTNEKILSLTQLHAFSNIKGLLMIIPIIIVVIIGFKTKDILTSLSFGIFAGVVLGIITGLISFNDIVNINYKDPSNLSGFVFDGIYSMVDISLTTIFLFGLISIMNDSQVIELICKKVTKNQFIKSQMGGELIILLGMGLVDILLSGCDLPAILLFSDVSNKIGHISDISSERRVILLISISASITSIIPINSVYVMGTVGLISQMKKINTFLTIPTPSTICIGSFFCWILTIYCLIWIFAGIGRNEKQSM